MQLAELKYLNTFMCNFYNYLDYLSNMIKVTAMYIFYITQNVLRSIYGIY